MGINAHLLSGQVGYRRAGIHQYIDQVLRHLPADESGPIYTIFTQQAAKLDGRSDMKILSSRWPTERRLVRIVWEQMIWPLLTRRLDLDLLHSMAFVTPFFSNRPTVVTVFDLSFIHQPDSFPTLQRLYLTSQTKRSCAQARRVITISESGRRDVQQYLEVPVSRIDVVTPGVEESYRPLPSAEVEAFRQQQNLPKRFILHVGTLQPRKNILKLIDAFARLNEPDLYLVLIGGKGWSFEEIFARVEELGIVDRVQFTGYVPDEALPYWYNAAMLFVFPSLYEGFGMPVVEAMACGTPVITSNTSSMPEAAGEAGLLFDPHDSEELADRIHTVLHDPDLAATMRSMGPKQALKFSWEKAGRETAVVYGRALKEA